MNGAPSLKYTAFPKNETEFCVQNNTNTVTDITIQFYLQLQVVREAFAIIIEFVVNMVTEVVSILHNLRSREVMILREASRSEYEFYGERLVEEYVFVQGIDPAPPTRISSLRHSSQSEYEFYGERFMPEYVAENEENEVQGIDPARPTRILRLRHSSPSEYEFYGEEFMPEYVTVNEENEVQGIDPARPTRILRLRHSSPSEYEFYGEEFMPEYVTVNEYNETPVIVYCATFFS